MIDHMMKLSSDWQIRALFRELLGRLESIELAGTPEQIASMLVSGPERLPVTFSFKS
jgi:cytochrome P450